MLFIKTYYIIFDIFYPTSSITINCNILALSSIKAEIDQSIKYHQKFIMWQFSIQVRKVKGWNGSWFPTLLSPLIASITGLLFCTTAKVLMPVENLLLSLYVCICLKDKRKIDAIVLAKAFIENLGDNTMKLTLIGILCILGIRYILTN